MFKGKCAVSKIALSLPKSPTPNVTILRTFDLGPLTFDKGILGINRLVQQVDHFLDGSFWQAFALLLQGIGKTHGNVLHGFVRFLGAADQEELVTARDAFVPAGVVKPNSQQAKNFRLAWLPVVDHWRNSLDYFFVKGRITTIRCLRGAGQLQTGKS